MNLPCRGALSVQIIAVRLLGAKRDGWQVAATPGVKRPRSLRARIGECQENGGY